MVKKIVTLIMISSLFLSSCKVGATVYYDDDQKADARLEQVIEAVENHDKEALRTMFSKQALDEAEDLEGRMDYLFEFVQGDIESWESIVSGAVDGLSEHGNKVKKVRSWYTVETDKEEYLFFILEYTEDTEHPENVGLYMLQVIKAQDEDTQFDGGQDILCPGIYRPEETESEDSTLNNN